MTVSLYDSLDNVYQIKLKIRWIRSSNIGMSNQYICVNRLIHIHSKFSLELVEDLELGDIFYDWALVSDSKINGNSMHIIVQGVQEKLCFHNSLQPLPRLHRCKRPSKLSNAMRVYSHSYWLVFFWKPIAPECWRRWSGKLSRILEKS